MRLLGHVRRPSERAGLVELFPTWANQLAETAPQNFPGMVEQVYKRSGVVAACVSARMMLFSEVKFRFRNVRSRELFGTEALRLLERPWPNGTTGELLSRMEQDASFAGNAYIYRAAPDRLQRLFPHLVDVMSNGREVVGYLYYPEGRTKKPIVLTRDEVAHYTPIPDPVKNFLGLSWVQSVMAEIVTDRKMILHQDKFYSNAATPNLFVKVEGRLSEDSKRELRAEFDNRYGGWENAYKTVVLDGGADLRAVGADFRQADFVATRAANENRIAQAASVPPIIIALQSGLENATYSNYEQALKQFSSTLRSLWRASCDALATIVDVPAGAELWWDETEVTALQDNAKNLAEINQILAATISSYITAGYTPESAVKAAVNRDPSALAHTGLFSVQLQPAGTDRAGDAEPAA